MFSPKSVIDENPEFASLVDDTEEMYSSLLRGDTTLIRSCKIHYSW